MLVQYPKPVNFPRVTPHICDCFPLQKSVWVHTDCCAVPMAGEWHSCSRCNPLSEVAWGQLAHLDFLREVLLNLKWPQAAQTWQTFRFSV